MSPVFNSFMHIRICRIIYLSLKGYNDIIMIIVVINIISSLKPLHILLLLFVYIIIIMIIIISKIHASTGIVVLISYDTMTSNERVKGITVVLFIV